MTALLRAEVEKLRTVWSTWVLLGICALATGAIGALVAYAPRGHDLQSALRPPPGTAGWFDEVFAAMSLGQDFALVLGVLMVTGEYRHRTVTATYLGEPRRGRVTAAKLLVAVAAGLAVGLVAAAAALLLGTGLVAAGNGSAAAMLGEYRQIVPGVLAAAVLFAAYGVGLGALLKNQVTALVTGLGLTAVVEPILVAVWPSFGHWLPNQAAQSLHAATASARGLGDGFAGLLPWWQGALLLVAYGVVLAAAGSLTTLRSDVT